MTIDAIDEAPASSGGAGSLKPVLDVIPARAYENPTWKGMSYFGRDVACYGGLVTALIFLSNPVYVIPIEIIMALVVVSLFVVGHDAAHGALFKTKRLNQVVGRLAMMPSWHVYEAWVLGHNRIHHPFTVRQGYDFVWHPVSAQEYADMSRTRKFQHRIHWAWYGAGLYYGMEIWWNKMINFTPPTRWVKAIRRDRVYTYSFVLGAAGFLSFLGAIRTHSVLGTLWMVCRIEVIPFALFCGLIGTVVHVHHVQPGIRWWKKAEWTKFKGQMEGTTVLRVPKGMNFFLHWIMIHTPHHVDMRIPMYNLDLAATAIKKHFPDIVQDAPLRFKDFRKNTRICKLYDFEIGQWMTYAEGRRRIASAL
jgi:omega-6 fatty acid desaturase (delta-12 desaturase)